MIHRAQGCIVRLGDGNGETADLKIGNTRLYFPDVYRII
jgi:hypothetical protein